MTYRIAAVSALVLALSACGGGGTTSVGSVPPVPASPGPAPTPGPTLASVTETSKQQIFAQPLYNASLETFGKGWANDAVPNSSVGLGYASNIRDADDFSVTYDSASGAYTVTRPSAGTEVVFAGEGSIAQDYQYVSLAQFYGSQPAGKNLETAAYGWFAVAQPTKPADMPITGAAHYSGQFVGWFAGDDGATWLDGPVNMDVDFASTVLRGDLTANLHCFMGCNADPVTYTMTDTRLTRGQPGFSGSLATPGAPSAGNFSGTFAGPGAAEMMAQVRFPYFNNQYQQWVDFGGAMLGKRD